MRDFFFFYFYKIKKIFNIKIISANIRLFFLLYNSKKNNNVFVLGKNFSLYKGIDRGIRTPSIYLNAYKELYEKKEISFLKNKIKKGDYIIDVGANIGFYSYFFLKFTSNKGRVFIFERHKHLKYLIEKNCLPFKNYTLFINEVGIEKYHLKLDDILKKRIDFIKIDVDGYDLNILKSAKNIIKKFKPKILIEISYDSHIISGIHYLDVLKFLINHGYRCHEINNYPKVFSRRLFKNEVLNIYCE